MSDQKQIDTSGSSDDVARWLWHNHVPKSGQAEFVQAEVLRAIERLRWEAQENGNLNWDESFIMLVDFIGSTLLYQECFSAEVRESIRSDLNRLKNFVPPDELSYDSQKSSLPYVDDDLYNRLTEHLVVYCKYNPTLTPHVANSEQNR